MHITTVCPECHSDKIIKVETRDWLKWNSGVYVQNAFPYLSPEDRESLITGYCGDCWDNLFSFGELEDSDV